METLFTFGSDRQFPYQRGYLTIEARTMQEAINEFRCRFPNPVHSHLVNCAFWYSEPEKIQKIKDMKNLGVGCHEAINLFDNSTLYGLLYCEQSDLDTGDKEFDEVVTACYISPEEFVKHQNEPYYQFCRFLYTHIETVDPKNAICDYTGFIEKHQRHLKEFTKRHWVRQYPDKDDFCEAWIGELHGYLAGNATSQNYRDLLACLEESEKSIAPHQSRGDIVQGR